MFGRGHAGRTGYAANRKRRRRVAATPGHAGCRFCSGRQHRHGCEGAGQRHEAVAVRAGGGREPPWGRRHCGSRACQPSAADGATLLIASQSETTMLKANRLKAPYDIDKDLVPIGKLMDQDYVLVVPASSGIKSWGEFLSSARSKGSAQLRDIGRRYHGSRDVRALGLGRWIQGDPRALPRGVGVPHGPCRGSRRLCDRRRVAVDALHR